MTRKLLATVLAASIALTTAGAAPVQAKSNDAAKILGGLAALYLISRIIKDNKRRTPVVAPVVVPTLPDRCLRTYYTPNGPREAYGAYCLNKRAPQLRLPKQCKRRISTDRGARNVYSPHCLQTHGYRVRDW